jgi:hypothetical protein
MLMGGDYMRECIICGQELDNHKKVGIILYNEGICHQCEYLITITPVHSKLYSYLINGLKKITLKAPA